MARKETNLPEIQWFSPYSSKNALAITIPNKMHLNFNKELNNQIPRHIAIGISRDGRTLYIKENPEENYSIPKSGMIRNAELIEALQMRGVHIPARFPTKRTRDFWTATLLPPNFPRPSSRTPKNSKKN